MFVPYCASTAADSRLLVAAVPNDVSGLVNSVPVLQPTAEDRQRSESSLLFRSVV